MDRRGIAHQSQAPSVHVLIAGLLDDQSLRQRLLHGIQMGAGPVNSSHGIRPPPRRSVRENQAEHVSERLISRRWAAPTVPSRLAGEALCCDPVAPGLPALFAGLCAHAQATNHRLTLVLAGTAEWTLAAAEAALHGCEAFWLTDRPVAATTYPLQAGERLLGQEVNYLVYDAHSGLDPDSFGAATGTLRGGGLLLLLTPPLDEWPDLPDPQAQRIAVYPFAPADVSGRFIARFARVLAATTGCWLVQQGAPMPPAPRLVDGPAASNRKTHRSPAAAATPDQEQAVKAIVKTARGRRRARRPLVITADRGRGKSAALGLAAAQLLAAGTESILVTAPRRAAVEPLFRHAAAALPEAHRDGDRLIYRQRPLSFIPPDRLERGAPLASLLLIDEAAGIPAPLLEAALTRFPRVVLATTIHGYEGTGRGFEVRFRDTLARLTPGWRALTLSQPIRWAANDPLEALTGEALLLDAAPAPAAGIATATPASCTWAVLERDRLAEDAVSLRQLFGLLVLAHYQTRPLDLRHLLDGPNVQVMVLRHGSSIVATLLTADEGGFNAPLMRQVFAGRRRPRGHLLPQTLSAHAGLAEAPELRYRRIIRLAVHPAVQGRGLGRRLVDVASDVARVDGIDLVGASFGATIGLLRFWTRCGFLPVQLGTHRNAASGEQALVVLRALTPRGESLIAKARQRLAQRLPRLMPGPLREAPPDLIAAVLGELPGRVPDLDEAAYAELTAFARHLRGLDASLPWLVELASARLGPALREGRLDSDQAALLVHSVLQMRDPGEMSIRLDSLGRSDVTTRIRWATERLLAETGGLCGPQ